MDEFKNKLLKMIAEEEEKKDLMHGLWMCDKEDGIPRIESDSYFRYRKYLHSCCKLKELYSMLIPKNSPLSSYDETILCVYGEF